MTPILLTGNTSTASSGATTYVTHTFTPPLSLLDRAVARREREIGPIAARKTTRTAALFAVRDAFWRYAWPELMDEVVSVRVFVFRVSFGLHRLRPVFVRLFGAPSALASAPGDAPAA